MPAHVLTQGNETVLLGPERRRVGRVRRAVQRLLGREVGFDAGQGEGGPPFAPDRHDRRQTAGFLKAFHAAQTAPGRASEIPAALHQRLHAIRCHRHPQLDAEVARHDVQLLDVRRGFDHTLAQAEADGKILEVGGCRHHDGVGDASIGQRDRGLLGDRACAGRASARAPHTDRNGIRRVTQIWVARGLRSHRPDAY